MLRATASINAIVCSAAAPILPAGELTTIIPSLEAVGTSTKNQRSDQYAKDGGGEVSPTLSTPTPALATTLSFLPASSREAVTFVSLLTIKAS